MNTLITLTMMFFLNVLKTTGDCPRSCECKWKRGKESVLCVNANMTEIPKQLDSGTQLLDLTGNRLRNIGADEFFNASLLNLQKIFMSRCKLRFIDRSSFRKVINLVELDLSYNELHSIPSHTFEYIGELRELRLNGNPIIRVLNYSFKMVPRLTKLDLSECRIGYVEIKAFQGLENSLEELKLDKNKITNIKPYALVNLGNLHGLELSGNPWNCSCGLRTLREWMLRQNVPYSIPPTCKFPPRLVGKIWDKLELDEFACPPRIQAVDSRKSGEEGSNVTMICSVHGNPEPSIRWLRKNHIIANLSGAANGGRQKVYIVRVAKEESNLTILAADVQDNGLYVCRAENKAGKSEANITLTVTMKPVARMWSTRTIVAVGVVSLLFATAVALLTFCAWSLRKRKFYFRHPVTRRELMDGYEMNHKKPISYDKIMQYGNHCSSNTTTNACDIPGRNSRADDFRERTNEISNEDKCEFGDFPGTLSSVSVKGDERVWNSLRMSDFDDRLSESSNSRLSPDLHIPRLNGHETHRNSQNIRAEETYQEDSPSSYKMASSNFLTSNLKIEPHYMRPEKTRDNQTFYTSALSDHKAPKPKKFPDLLELSRNEENLINNNSFSTMPRKRSYKAKRTRHGSLGSESQSPLLPGSSGDSCDSNFSSSRRPSVESSGLLRNASLPTSPSNLGQTPILNLLDGSPDVYSQSPTSLKYKSWELEKFLKEYRNLQDQLYKMKESCENLKEDNLKFREGGDSSTSVENTTISKMISPVYGDSSSIEPFYGVNKKFLDDSRNLESLYTGGSGFLVEDNNNPKSILKNKSFDRKSVLDKLDLKNGSHWSQRNKYLNALAETSSGNSFYQS